MKSLAPSSAGSASKQARLLAQKQRRLECHRQGVAVSLLLETGFARALSTSRAFVTWRMLAVSAPEAPSTTARPPTARTVLSASVLPGGADAADAGVLQQRLVEAQRQLLESHAEQKRAVEKQVEALRDELAAALSAVQNGTADRARVRSIIKGIGAAEFKAASSKAEAGGTAPLGVAFPSGVPVKADACQHAVPPLMPPLPLQRLHQLHYYPCCRQARVPLCLNGLCLGWECRGLC